MTDNDKNDGGVTIERDHPQTRKGEDDARGSAQWNEDVVKPEEAREQRGDRANDGSPAGGGDAPDTAGVGPRDQLTPDEEAAVSRHAQGGPTIGDSIGGDAGMDKGSGTPGDSGDLGGGAQGAGNSPGGASSPGGNGR